MVNDQPVIEGQIAFHPADGKGSSAAGRIEYGSYSLKVSPGEKIVEIFGQREIPGRYGEELVDGKKVLMREEYIPARYNTKSELRVTVSTRPSTENFSLQPE
jgi:hypothetical protein